MECVDAKLRMEPYATGNLSSPDREAFEEHVAHCEGCRLELELTKAMSGSGEIEEPLADSAADAPSAPEPAAEPFGSGAASDAVDPHADVLSADAPSEGAPEAGAAADSEISFADIAPEIQDDSSSDLPLDTLLSSVQPPEAMPVAAHDLPAEPGAPPSPASARTAPPSGERMPSPPAPGGGRASVDDPLANLVASTPAALPASPQAPAGGAPSPATSPAGATSAGEHAWEFEPADAKRQAPPEGSLFMAEEALQRGKASDADRRRALLRATLWIAGGVAGVALLAFAGWIALNARPVPPRTASVETGPAGAGEAAGTPSATAPSPGAGTTPAEPAAPAEAPDASQSTASPSAAPQSAPEPAAPGSAAPGSAPVVEAGAASAQSPLPSSEGTASASSGQAPGTRTHKVSTKARPQTGAVASRSRPADARSVTRPHGERVGSSHGASPGTPASPATPGAGHREAFAPATSAEGSAAAAGESQASSPSAASPARESAAAPAPSKETQIATPGAQTGPSTPPAAGEPARAPGAAPGEAPGEAGSPAVSAPSGGASSTPPAASAQPAPAPGATTQQAAPGTPSAGAGAPTADAVQRPIDRIHLATVAAEERGDLSALRKMRDTWRSFIDKTGVGADRIRAKHELADCLWAIQSLTARRSDQRDALRAYRDYILNAPAGGADARSISRTRQLEDALSESR